MTELATPDTEDIIEKMSQTKLIAALIQAQMEFKPVLNTKLNPFHHSKYAPLVVINEAVDGALWKNGLTVIQKIVFDPDVRCSKRYPVKGDSKEYEWRDVVGGNKLLTVLAHVSGEIICSEYLLSPVKDDPQGEGSAITYARRYAKSAILGLAAEDDDGNEASGKKYQGIDKKHYRGHIAAIEETLSMDTQAHRVYLKETFGVDSTQALSDIDMLKMVIYLQQREINVLKLVDETAKEQEGQTQSDTPPEAEAKKPDAAPTEKAKTPLEKEKEDCNVLLKDLRISFKMWRDHLKKQYGDKTMTLAQWKESNKTLFGWRDTINTFAIAVDIPGKDILDYTCAGTKSMDEFCKDFNMAMTLAEKDDKKALHNHGTIIRLWLDHKDKPDETQEPASEPEQTEEPTELI